jgi:hypothetical protein
LESHASAIASPDNDVTLSDVRQERKIKDSAHESNSQAIYHPYSYGFLCAGFATRGGGQQRLHLFGGAEIDHREFGSKGGPAQFLVDLVRSLPQGNTRLDRNALGLF